MGVPAVSDPDDLELAAGPPVQEHVQVFADESPLFCAGSDRGEQGAGAGDGKDGDSFHSDLPGTSAQPRRGARPSGPNKRLPLNNLPLEVQVCKPQRPWGRGAPRLSATSTAGPAMPKIGAPNRRRGPEKGRGARALSRVEDDSLFPFNHLRRIERIGMHPVMDLKFSQGVVTTGVLGWRNGDAHTSRGGRKRHGGPQAHRVPDGIGPSLGVRGRDVL